MTVLLTGGSANGKSTFAEGLASRLPDPVVYLATMIPYGPDAYSRIGRHQAQRAGRGFVTIEKYTGLAGVTLPGQATVLLECLCNLTANEMFETGGAGPDTVQTVVRDVMEIAGRAANLIVVTNDTGSDGSEYAPEVLAYIEALGQINRQLAHRFDCVCELCCGIPLVVKGTLP